MGAEEEPLAPIHVFLVDAAPTSLHMTRTLLASDERLSVAGSAGSLREALDDLSTCNVDVVLVNDNIGGPETPKAVWQISSSYRDLGVVVIGQDTETETLRRYILAGARGFVSRPIDATELRQTLHQVSERLLSARQARDREPTPPTGPLVLRRTGELGHIVAVFGAKGGVGKTTVTVNLSVALRRATEQKVGVVDADWAFGDIGLLFDLNPVTTVLDFAEYVDERRDESIDHEYVKRLMARHEVTGIRVMLSVARPAHADLITSEHVHALLAELPRLFDYIVLDCPVAYEERILIILEHADQLLLVVTPEVGALKNARGFLGVTQALGFDRERIDIVLNRANSHVDITPSDVQQLLGVPVQYHLPSGGSEVARAANRGVPLTVRSPTHPVSRGITAIARDVISLAEATRQEKHTGMLRLPKEFL